MAIVGTCKNGTPDQLSAWTSNRFVVFLERDPAGFPPYLNGRKAAKPSPKGENGGPAQQPKPVTTDQKSVRFHRRNPQGRGEFFEWPDRTQHLLVEAVNASLGKRFFFDIRANGSCALRADAPERIWGNLTGRCPDMD